MPRLSIETVCALIDAVERPWMDWVGRVKLLHSPHVHPGMVYTMDTRQALGEQGVAPDWPALSVLINQDWLEAERSKPTYRGDAELAALIWWAVQVARDDARMHATSQNLPTAVDPG